MILEASTVGAEPADEKSTDRAIPPALRQLKVQPPPPLIAWVRNARTCAGLLAWAIALAGCEDQGRLVVDLRTDLVPEYEFAWVRVEFDRASGTDRTERPAAPPSGPLAAFRVAEFDDLPPGDYSLAVVLLDQREREVMRRPLRVRVRGSTAVTVLITRDCRGVTCDDANAAACLGGRCVDASCTEEKPETCGAARCTNDADCGSDVACGVGRCTSGVCVELPRENACEARDRCDLDRGCVPDVERWSLTAGYTASCLSRGEGDVWCWGSNDQGLVSNDENRTVLQPVRVVDAPSSLERIAAGGGHACAVDAAGAVFCWGRNRRGQLGDGTTQSRSRPTGPIAGLPPIVSLGLGADHTCAVDQAGALYCWGANDDGQLGIGTRDDRPTPQQVTAIAAVAQVSAAAFHTCALTTAGAVHCWGSDRAGSFARGASSLSPGDALRVPASRAIGTTEEFGCALTTDDRVYCWGANFAGQLGTGDRTHRDEPTGPVVGLPPARALAVGSRSACALTTDSRVFCWGDGGNGQLGNDTVSSQAQATEPVRDVSGVASIGAGRRTMHAIERDGSLVVWGANWEGQAGVGDLHNQLTQRVRLPLSNTTAAAIGATFGCAIADGGLWCWGGNDDGQLGIGTSTGFARPVPAPESAVTSLAAHGHACGVDRAGVVRCWGRNSHGQLGGGAPSSWASPTAVAGLPAVARVVVGSDHSCALDRDGGAWCWGGNWSGMLGDGTLRDRLLPFALALPPIGALGSSAATMYAIDRDGLLWVWGNRYDRTPRRILGVEDVVSVSGSWQFECLRRRGGELWCFDQDDLTPVDDGYLLETDARVELAEPTLAVAVGAAHWCALGHSERVYCWGDNEFGQLATGDRERRDVPTLVEGLENVRALASSIEHTCALLRSGRVFCFGRGDRGQIGGGNRLDALRPVEVTFE